MKVCCIQPKLKTTRTKCYNEVETIIKKVLNENDECDILCLPERWVPFYNNDLSKNFQDERGSDYSFIKKIAKEYSVKILSGAIWEKRKGENKPSITCYYFDEFGDEVGRQDKLHLYAYERGQFNPGNKLYLFKLKSYRFAILICFDMAFFETPRLAAENGADLLFSPTQIRMEGMENWSAYLKTRALENRIPVIACNTVGTIFDRKFLGKSKIISFETGYYTPSKLKIVEAPEGESGFAFDNIDLDFPKKMRKKRLSEKIDISKIEVIKL
ncbi:MAG: carbon-nitrogen hydrolase family protein [Promethearchaeota archaeon]